MMNQTNLKKLLCLLLAILTCISMVSCNNDSGKEQPTEAPTEEETAAQVAYPFTPTEDYVIVRSDLYASDENTTDACFYLKKAIEKAYGFTPEIVTDATDAKGKKEFLVGPTNRAFSKQLVGALYLNDYTYAVPTKNAIVIGGGSPEKTLEAVEKFCTDILTYDGKKVATKNPEITTKTKYLFEDTYEYSTVMLNGVLWEDYTMVVTSGGDIAGAVELNRQIGQYTGQVLPVLSLSEMTGEEEAIIRVGAAYRNGTGSNDLNGYMINSYVDELGRVICIDAVNGKSYKDCVDKLLGNTEKTIEDTTVSFEFEQETLYSVLTGNDNKLDYMHWELSDEKTETISEGVTYTEQVYYDDEGLPYRVYTLVVDLKTNKIAMGCSNDGYEYRLVDPADRQTTMQHMQSAVANGKNVIAGINADFFDNSVNHATWPGDYHPWGLTIKDGTLISRGDTELRPLVGYTGNVRPFFGFTKDGRPVIAMESEYASDAMLATLEHAVGGAYILAEEGKTNFFKMQHSIIHSGIHPRGLVGFREDGTVILMVIDGRQPAHSNGASLLQCSLLMHRFGASDAMLMDGGGSSCMVLRDPDTNTYTTVDKPSDGQLRKIYNSLLVIKK